MHSCTVGKDALKASNSQDVFLENAVFGGWQINFTTVFSL